MMIIGLTGSIGMGKSTVASQVAALGVKTLNSDVVVHQLLAKGGAGVDAVAERFPQALENEAINRIKLGQAVFGSPEKLAALEAVLHPLVVEAQGIFCARMQRLGARVVLLDIPLLFETGAEVRMDATIVVTAPAFLQRARVLARPGMTEEKLQRILSRQMPDAEKRLRADYVIHTGLGRAYSFRQIKHIMKEWL